MTESAIYLWSAVFSLHFTFSLYFIPGLQFAVWTLWSAFYTDRYSKWKVDHMKSRLDHIKCRVYHIKSKKHSGSCSQLTLLCESNPEIMIIYTSTHETFITLLFSLTLLEHFFQSQDFQWFRSMIMNIYSNCDKLLNCQQGLMMNDKVLKW